MKKHIAQTYDSSAPNSTTFAVIVILQVSCEGVIIEKDDVAKGLEELIAQACGGSSSR
jgi:hypothetical protein